MARRMVSNLKEEYLSCSICLEQYNMPKTLPCDHIFCQECLVNHVKKTIKRHKSHVEVTCPICRFNMKLNCKANFDARAWVNTLPTDSLVGSLMQTLKKHERAAKSPDSLPKLCELHGGKPCDAYCFTHAQLLCWECAAREHRVCSVDSADKARHMLKPEIEALKNTVESQLTRARELSKSDVTFSNSKTKALSNLEEFENRIENVYGSAKHQLSLLRTEVEKVSKLHQDERKNFYDVVTSLLELHCSLEILSSEQEPSDVFGVFENVKKEVEKNINNFQKIERESKNNEEQHVKFIPDERVETFLTMYSGVGFVDSNVPGSSATPDSEPTPRSAPDSLSHIFKRSKSVDATKNTKK